MTLRVALLGTFHPAVPTLRRLAEHGLVSVLVLPEEAGVKNHELLEIADEFAVPWTYSLSDLDARTVDAVVAANYPKLVPKRLLDAVPCINTHWSLLPRYRGVHPTAWALLNGDDHVGVTVHVMGAEFDTGPVLAQASLPLTPRTELVALHEQLANLQADLVIVVLGHLREHGELPEARLQDEAQATYVPQRDPSDGLIDWAWPTARIHALVRALPAPQYPGAFTHIQGRKLIIWEAKPAATPEYFATLGQIVRVRSDGSVWVKTGDTCLAVQTVQWEDQDRTEAARDVLKRGTRLGIRPELEVVDLIRRVGALERDLRELRGGAGG